MNTINTTTIELIEKENISKSSIKAILSEFNYQEKMWNETTTETAGKSSNTSFLVFIQSYLAEAIDMVSRNPEPKASLLAAHNIRKIGTMALNCALKNNWLEQLVSNDYQQNSEYTLVESLAYISFYTNKGFENAALFAPESVKINISLIFWTCMHVMSISDEFAPLRVD